MSPSPNGADTLMQLVGRLGPSCRKSLERAAALCVQRNHFYVEPEHLLLALLEKSDSDLSVILKAYGVDASAVRRQIEDAIAGFKSGATRTPAFSAHLTKMLEEGWVRTSLILGEQRVRSAALLLALLETDTFRTLLLNSAPTLLTVAAPRLRTDYPGVCAGSSEGEGPSTPPQSDSQGVKSDGALAAYTLDLTGEAQAGRIDPVFGREREIRAVIDILMRRRQNNPILTGEAGVGKTAVVEGLAQRIASGDVPPALRGVRLRTLDLGLLQAGTSLKGEFENRLKGVIAEVKASPHPIILFIDEAHTLMGAGGEQGVGDAANLLKPALARGELRTIGATTWAEYKKTIEKDPALARRFQVVKVGEPDEDTATGMLRGLVPTLERHHGVHIRDQAVIDAVRLSARYIAGRQLPDKAISVLDTACARVALGLHGKPVELEALDHHLSSLDRELIQLRRESAQGLDHSGRLDDLDSQRQSYEDQRAALHGRWEQEKQTVEKIHALQQRLAEVGCESAEDLRTREDLKSDLAGLRLELDVLQEGTPLVQAAVDEQAVAAVVSTWTGVPVGRMVSDEIQAVLSLRDRLAERVIGQTHALDAVARRIQTSRAGLDEPGKPTGVFLLAGPSGVGKTETALTIAEVLFGGERRLVTINMSEYQEPHSVSRLKGAPPGYVGFGQGGVLTEAVKRNPYCVVLLDEVEKAHPDVIELFYQVFDKGMLEDTDGVVVDFKNTVIILTSNLGTQTITDLCQTSTLPPPETLEEAIRPELTAHFKAALLGRCTVVPYYPLDRTRVEAIVTLKLEKIQTRFAESHGVPLDFDPAVAATIAARCLSTDSGARAIDHLLTGALLPDLSVTLLRAMAQTQDVLAARVSLNTDEGGFAITLRLANDHTPHGEESP